MRNIDSVALLFIVLLVPIPAIAQNQTQPTIAFGQPGYATSTMSCNSEITRKVLAQEQMQNKATVIITDAGANKYSTSIDRVAVWAWSDSDRKGIQITAYETAVNSGIFKGTFTVSDSPSTADVLHVVDGDTITAKYAGTTPWSLGTANHGITATAFIVLLCPPLERVPASGINITDNEGTPQKTILVDRQIEIGSNLKNVTIRNQTFAYIVQISGEHQNVASLSSVSGSLLPSQTFSPSISWTPQRAGNYNVQVFVWQSINNPNALSPPLSTDLTVYPSKSLYAGSIARDAKNGQCLVGYELVINPSNSFHACVTPDTAQILVERGWAKEITTQTGSHGPPMKPFGPRIPAYGNITNSTSSLVTTLSSTVFPTVAMESFDGVSVKGYLTNQNGTGLTGQEIMFYLNNATLDNDTTISENLLMGKTTTDQTGCFYFVDWDANKSLEFHNEVFTTSPSGNGLANVSDNVLVYINTVFPGTNYLSNSSNTTKIMYHPVIPPIMREAGINAYLMNASSYFPHYSAIPILEVERGKSYNFTAFSSWSESLNVQTFRLEIKNLPCGINVPAVDVSDLTNKTQAIVPVKMIIDKSVPVGSFFPYISVNNTMTGPLDLEIK